MCRTLTAFLSAVTLLVFAAVAQAQTFFLVAFSIESGSEFSAGYEFSAEAFVAPPAAGTMTGETYQAVATPMAESAEPSLAPPLLIAFVDGGDSITIAWPKENTAWQLQESPSLFGTAWSAVPASYLTNATHLSVTVPASSGTRFYRLEQP